MAHQTVAIEVAMSTFNRKQQIMEQEPSTQEEIIEMVMQIGGCDRPEDDSPALKMFVTFAHLVAAKEREACAQYCDMNSHSPIDMAAILAEAIRARGEA